MEYGESTPGPVLRTGTGEGTPPPNSPILPPEPQFNRNEVLRMPNIQTIVSRLPDYKNCIPSLLALKFFAITPSGKRVPIAKFCGYAEDFPEDSVLRTFDNRLLTILEAIQPDGKTYWKQAFYMSSGESSNMADTWLPMDAITFDPPMYIPTDSTNVEGTLWFDKTAFVESNYTPLLKNTKVNILQNLAQGAFAKCGLPEGNVTGPKQTLSRFNQKTSPFDRFGCISYYLASYEMGGGYVHRSHGYAHLKHLEYLGYNHLDQLRDRLAEKDSQPCFTEFQKSLPFVSLPVINTFISRHKAFSYDNIFRQEGYRIPSMQDVSVLISNLGYSVPVKGLHIQLTPSIRQIKIQSILSTTSPDKIQELLDSLVDDLETSSYFNYKNSRIIYKVTDHVLEKNEAFLGGKRRRRVQSRKRNTTRRSTRRKGSRRR